MQVLLESKITISKSSERFSSPQSPLKATKHLNKKIVKDNLETLMIEMLSEYIHDRVVLLPMLVQHSLKLTRVKKLMS